MKRYVTGALYAATTFGVTYGLLIIGAEASASRMIRLRNLADLVFALSVINMIVLLSIQGPILLAMRRLVRRPLPPAAALFMAVWLAPLGTFVAWLMFRERNETIMGLVSWIHNVPGEFTINFVPNIVSAGLFAMWILSAAEPHLAQSQEPRA